MKVFKYIEIKDWGDGGVIQRIDVSGKTDKHISNTEAGINHNLNCDQYYTFVYESVVELDVI